MQKSSSRGSRIAAGVAALAMGGALALPATAAADPIETPVVDVLTATLNGENTDVTITLRDGVLSCAGPVVITGKLSDQGADAWDFDADTPVPAGHKLVYPTKLAEIGHVDSTTSDAARTVSLPLGSAPHTALARCAGETGPVTYIRPINPAPTGPGLDLSQGSLGSLDFFGSLGFLDPFGSLGSVVLQSTGTLGSLGSANSGS